MNTLFIKRLKYKMYSQNTSVGTSLMRPVSAPGPSVCADIRIDHTGQSSRGYQRLCRSR